MLMNLKTFLTLQYNYFCYLYTFKFQKHDFNSFSTVNYWFSIGSSKVSKFLVTKYVNFIFGWTVSFIIF